MQLVGEIELASERGHPYEFLSPVRDLAPPGELHSLQTFPFEFRSVEMQYESYRGMQVRLRYMLRVTVVRGLGQSVVKDYPFWVQNPTEDIPPAGDPIKVGPNSVPLFSQSPIFASGFLSHPHVPSLLSDAMFAS